MFIVFNVQDSLPFTGLPQEKVIMAMDAWYLGYPSFIMSSIEQTASSSTFIECQLETSHRYHANGIRKKFNLYSEKSFHL